MMTRIMMLNNFDEKDVKIRLIAPVSPRGQHTGSETYPMVFHHIPSGARIIMPRSRNQYKTKRVGLTLLELLVNELPRI